LAPIAVDDIPDANTQNLAAQTQFLSQLREETSVLQPNVNAPTLLTSLQPKPKRKLEDSKDTESKCVIKKTTLLKKWHGLHIMNSGLGNICKSKMSVVPQ
jgi:hypothetical protein